MTLLEEARALAPTLEELKAQLHRRPELSFHEVNTTAKSALCWSRWGWNFWTWAWRPA